MLPDFGSHDVIGHVTIRLEDSQWVVSYRWSIDTNPWVTLIGRCKI